MNVARSAAAAARGNYKPLVTVGLIDTCSQLPIAVRRLVRTGSTQKIPVGQGWLHLLSFILTANLLLLYLDRLRYRFRCACRKMLVNESRDVSSRKATVASFIRHDEVGTGFTLFHAACAANLNVVA